MKLKDIAPINEGGQALKHVNTIRIKREDIPATIKYVSELIGVPKKDLHPLGSVGKARDSGDVDLAVDTTRYSPTDLHNILVQKIGPERSVYNKGTQVGSYAIPIRGDEGLGLVQVDLMWTSNPKWAQFTYYSEGERSRYKGVVRALLLKNVAAAINEPGTDHFDYDPTSGHLIIRAGRTLDFGVGLRRIFQYRPKKAKGEGYVAMMKSISLDDLKAMYPDIEIKGGQVIVDDPEKALKAMFGSGVRQQDVRTVEQIIPLIKKRFDLKTQEEIFKRAAQGAKAHEGRIRLPPEIEQYF